MCVPHMHVVCTTHSGVCPLVLCGVLCQWGVQLGAVFELCVRSLDCCELHVTCRCLWFRGVVSENLIQLHR